MNPSFLIPSNSNKMIEVKKEAVDDFEEEKVLIQSGNYFPVAVTSVKEEKPDLESENTKIPTTVPLEIVKSELGCIECIDLRNCGSGTPLPKLELRNNVKVEDFFLDLSNTSKVKKEVNLYEKLKTELLSEECDLPTIKQEDINFDEPGKQSQERLIITSNKQAVKKVKKKKHRYPCPVCRKDFSSRNLRKAHLNKHVGKRSACWFCGEFLIYKTQFLTHYFVHFIKKRKFMLSQQSVLCDNKKTFTCIAGPTTRYLKCHSNWQISPTEFANNEAIRVRIETHAGEKPFKCEICSKRFTVKGTLTVHMRSHTGVNLSNCPICSKEFQKNSHLKVHMRSHTGEKLFKCEICSKRFIRKNQVLSHMISHTGVKPFKCEICGKGFAQKGTLTIHVGTHTDEKHFKCEICSKQFKQKGSLKSHIISHTIEKPFKCEICWKQCKRKGSLTVHMRSHTGVNLIKCQICSKRFQQNSHLKVHMRSHTGEKPFRCDICWKRFIRKDGLVNHMVSHNEERPFECELCYQRFKRGGQLNSHLMGFRIHKKI